MDDSQPGNLTKGADADPNETRSQVGLTDNLRQRSLTRGSSGSPARSMSQKSSPSGRGKENSVPKEKSPEIEASKFKRKKPFQDSTNIKDKKSSKKLKKDKGHKSSAPTASPRRSSTTTREATKSRSRSREYKIPKRSPPHPSSPRERGEREKSAARSFRDRTPPRREYSYSPRAQRRREEWRKETEEERRRNEIYKGGVSDQRTGRTAGREEYNAQYVRGRRSPGPDRNLHDMAEIDRVHQDPRYFQDQRHLQGQVSQRIQWPHSSVNAPSWQDSYTRQQMPHTDGMMQSSTCPPRWDASYYAPQVQPGQWLPGQNQRQVNPFPNAWASVGLPQVRDSKGKMKTMEIPPYLLADLAQLCEQRVAAQTTINGKNTKEQSTLKFLQTTMGKLLAIRNSNEVN